MTKKNDWENDSGETMDARLEATQSKLNRILDIVNRTEWMPGWRDKVRHIIEEEELLLATVEASDEPPHEKIDWGRPIEVWENEEWTDAEVVKVINEGMVIIHWYGYDGLPEARVAMPEVESPDMEHRVRNAPCRVTWVDGTCQQMKIRFSDQRAVVIPTGAAMEIFEELKEAFDR